MQETDAALIEGLKKGVKSGDFIVFDPNDPDAVDADEAASVRDETDGLDLADAADPEVGAARDYLRGQLEAPVTLDDAHREWHAIHGADTVCPLDCSTVDLDNVDTDPAPTPDDGPGNTATDKQIRFINTLKDERDPREFGDRIAADRQLWADRRFTVAAASSTIEFLLSLRRSNDRTRQEPLNVPEGMHQLGDRIYKVQRSPQTGHLYAKRLTAGSFVYTAGAIRKLSPDTYMTIEQAKAYGALYGTCVRCGRTLTAEDSIDRMMGPVCYSKQFG